LLGSTIGNPKYLEGLGGLDPPPPRFNNYPTKILSTFLGISICMLTKFVPLGVCGLDLIPGMIWTSIIVNGDLVIITIEWGIATKYNGIDLIGSTLKLEVVT
jgi:hypothetical protein